MNVVLLVAEESFESRMELTLEAKRGLFEATVGADTETDSMERSTLARRIATLLNESFAATTAKLPVEPAEPTAAIAEAAPGTPPDPVAEARKRLGEQTLDRLMRTRDGRLVGIVAEGAALPPPEAAGPVMLLPAQAATALGAFGEASPLSGAEVLFERATAPALSPEHERRSGQLAAAQRKLAGARALAAQDLGGEALGLLRDGLALLCRAAAATDPGEATPALLATVFGELVPSSALTASEAAALARAGELARAFGSSPARPPAPLVEDLAKEASALHARLSQSLVAGTQAVA
ncbi:MAG: hypothetical protein QM765_46925 [Myxococcales bacterium]